MRFKYVVAIVLPGLVPPLELKLQNLGVDGITLTRVKGFGEYKNFFSKDWLNEYTKVEILAEESKVDALLDTLQDLAIGAGIVAVVSVDRFLHLRTGTEDLPQKPV